MTLLRPAEDLPPGPTGREWLTWLQALRRDPLRTLPAAVHRWGDVVHLTIPPGRGHRHIVLVAHPDGVQQVLQSNHRNYRRPRTYDILKLLLGEGLLTSEGERWKRNRRMAQPAFHPHNLEHFARVMVEATEERLAGWEDHLVTGRSIDAANEMQALTLDIVGRSLLSSGLHEQAGMVGDVLSIALGQARKRGRSALPVGLPRPTPSQYRFRRAVRELDDLVHGMIRARRGHEEDHGDLLSMLLLAVDSETGETMSDGEIRDELVTFMLAGHETTANALAWAWYLLSTHPRVRSALEDELDRVLGGRPPTFGDVGELRYTRMVVDEVMRLYPPAWMIERASVDADAIGGHRVPADAMVMTSPWITHRHRDVWEDPEAFVPERFSAERSRDRHRYAHFPFGGGPRLCIGRDFALVEAVLVLATVAQRFRLDLVPGFPVQPAASVTLRPAKGVRVTLRSAD